MYDNYNYPAGADTPEAPWNQPVIPEKDFEVDVEYILQKKRVKVSTNDYIPEQVLKDESIVEPLSTDDTNWENAYTSSRYTVLELIDKLKDYVQQDLERHKDSGRKERELKELLDDCEGWELYDSSYSESE